MVVSLSTSQYHLVSLWKVMSVNDKRKVLSDAKLEAYAANLEEYIKVRKANGTYGKPIDFKKEVLPRLF